MKHLILLERVLADVPGDGVVGGAADHIAQLIECVRSDHGDFLGVADAVHGRQIELGSGVTLVGTVDADRDQDLRHRES